jgi:uncharacterized membrane protein
MVTNATVLRGSAQTDPAMAWHLVVRTAVAGSLVVVAIAYALHTFVKLSDTVIVAVIAVLGLAIGTRLPAATLPIPHWLVDETDGDLIAS